MNLQTLDTTLSLLGPIAALTFLGALLYAVVTRFGERGGSARAVATLLGVGVGGIVLLFPLGAQMASGARGEVLHFLGPINAPFTLTVEGTSLDASQRSALLHALRTISLKSGTHSHAQERFEVRVTDKSSRVLKLQLGRDSRRPREYWVFYPAYSTTDRKEIGRFSTPLFDEH